jgi:hypothetical protein
MRLPTVPINLDDIMRQDREQNVSRGIGFVSADVARTCLASVARLPWKREAAADFDECHACNTFVQ